VPNRRDTQGDQVFGGQFRKNGAVYVFIGEIRPVLLKPDAAQPERNIIAMPAP
jgi:hypothetical protein